MNPSPQLAPTDHTNRVETRPPATTRSAPPPTDPAAREEEPDDTAEDGWWNELALRGRGLRFVLVDELRGRPSMTVAELVTAIAGYGFELQGRASKVISDALRWEIRRGRVVRLGRGLYSYHRAPVSTGRRIRIFADHARRWIVATTRTETPPPTPPNPRQTHPHLDDPTRIPWLSLTWLWTR